MRKHFVLTAVAALLFVAAPADAQRQCTRGKPCGNTCIAMDKVCRVGQGSATWGQTPTAQPRTAATDPWQRRLEDSIAAAPAPLGSGGNPCQDPVYLAMRRVDVGLMTKVEYEAFHLREYACAQYVQARVRVQPIRRAQTDAVSIFAPERQPPAAVTRGTRVIEARPGHPSHALGRGSLLIGGHGHFQSTGSNDDDDFDIRVSELRVNPSLQYFVAPGFAIGGELTVHRLALGGLAGTTFGIGPRFSYYFGGPGAAVHPFLATSGTFLFSPSDDGLAIGVRPSVGLLVMLARNVGITGEGFFSFDTPLSDDGGSTNTFGLAVGIAAFVF